jgi:thioredoxin-related protein
MRLRILIIAFLMLLKVNIIDAQESKGGLTWFTDIKKADAVSKSSGKPIFAFFTGSDWCGWCHKLQADVFSKKSFIDWAKKNVVLLELDFPRKKQLPQELAEQNQSLQQALQVRGYPTVWLLYLETKEDTKQINLSTLGSLGYPSGAETGKEEVKFLNEANAILKKGN